MSKVAFRLTGFSTFNGVRDNPTECLMKWLGMKLEDADFVVGQTVEVQDARTLRVAAREVDEYFVELGRNLEQGSVQVLADIPSADGSPPVAHTLGGQRQRTVLLHFGVDTTASEYRLESRAYNCANFRVPDELGWCPSMQEIESGHGLGSWVGSRLPLGMVSVELAARGHNVVVSSDAGQFVCNWTYYRACRLAERYGLEALFVHVPPFAVLDETKQRAFLLDVLQVAARCLMLGE